MIINTLVRKDLGIIKNILSYIRMFIFTSVYLQLWYLISLIWGIAFIYLFLKKDKIKMLCIISVFLYLFGVIGTSYFGLVEGTFINKLINIYNLFFENTRKGLCFSVPFITLGILINKYNLNNKLIKKEKFIIIFFALLTFEAYIIKISNISRDYSMYLSLIFLIPLIFIYLLNYNIKVKRKISKVCKDLSLGIYCSHGVLIIISSYFYTEANIFKFIFIIVGSIIITMILNKSKFKFLKNMVR